MGTTMHPIKPDDGYIESALKLLRVTVEDTTEEEKDKEFIDFQNLDSKFIWSNAISKAIDSGAAKSIQHPLSKTTRRHGNSLKRNAFNARLMWNLAIYKIINVIRTVKATVSVVAPTAPRTDKSLVSQLRDFQAQNDSMTTARVFF